MSEARSIRYETYLQLLEVRRIGSRAVRAAQEESRRLGVPNVYSIHGILHYELPSGELSTRDPWAESTGPGRKER